SDDSHGTGEVFTTIIALALDESTGNILVLDYLALYSIDPSTGNRTTLVDAASTTPALTPTYDMSADNGIAYLVGCYGDSGPCQNQILTIPLSGSDHSPTA